MMKTVLYGLIAILAFLVSLVLALALTGNFSKEALNRLMNNEPEMTAEAQPEADPLGPLAAQLKKKQEELKAREAELQAREAQLEQRAQSLAQLQTQLEEIQQKLYGSLEDAEAEQALRLKTIAVTVEAMKPDKAAERLAKMPPDDVAEILAQVKDKSRGKIVEAMDPEFATNVLRAMQDISVGAN